MKRTVILACLSVLLLPVKAQEFEKATEAVKNMKVGWNLGNTLDAHSGSTGNMWIEKWTDRSPSAYETAWGQPVTTLELIRMFKDAGFNAIRVPVTWYPHMGLVTNDLKWDKQQNPLGDIVDSVWMKRVHEIVDYVISAGMYCIINVHHDTGDSDVAWIVADRDIYNSSKDRFIQLWTQIAEEFKDYDEHLLFEGYNEILDLLGSWNYASSKASGGYDRNIASSAYDAVNGYAQSFVDAVRATGGNNLSRNLIVTNYAAYKGAGTDHFKDSFNSLVIPKDTVEGHIMLEVHSYILEMNSLSACKSEAVDILDYLYKSYVKNNIPVVVGEWGTLNSSGNDYSDSGRYANYKKYCKYFVEQAKKKDIATLYWMDLSEGQDRSIPKWTRQDLKDEIIKGYYGDNGYVEVAPVKSREQVSYHSDYWLNDHIIIRNGKKFFIK